MYLLCNTVIQSKDSLGEVLLSIKLFIGACILFLFLWQKIKFFWVTLYEGVLRHPLKNNVIFIGKKSLIICTAILYNLLNSLEIFTDNQAFQGSTNQ